MEDRKDTYLSRAQADVEIESQDRFKKYNPTTVTGVTPEYPRQPDNSPWSSPDPTGPEPPFPIDIDFVAELGGASAPAIPSDAVEPAPPTRGASSALTDAPPFLRRREW